MESFFLSATAFQAKTDYFPVQSPFKLAYTPLPQHTVYVRSLAKQMAETQKNLVTSVLANNPKPEFIAVGSVRFTQYHLN